MPKLFTQRPTSFLILAAIVVILAGGLYLGVSKFFAPNPVWFSDQIIFTTQPGVSAQRVTDIITALHGTLLQPAGFPKDSPNWLMGVPWAKNEGDTDRVVQQLRSYPEIQHAEVNGLAGNSY